jgi:hypothetical protein
VAAGVLKIVYDLMLLAAARNMPEVERTEATKGE